MTGDIGPQLMCDLQTSLAQANHKRLRLARLSGGSAAWHDTKCVSNGCFLKEWHQMGVSLNGGTPKTPKNDHFSKEKPWLLGTPFLGNPQILNHWVRQIEASIFRTVALYRARLPNSTWWFSARGQKMNPHYNGQRWRSCSTFSAKCLVMNSFDVFHQVKKWNLGWFIDTVDGSEIRNNHLRCIKSL